MSNQQRTSEVARLRQQIADEYVAAIRGLAGLASGTAQHRFITHRMECISAYHSDLQKLVGEQEAIKLIVDTLERL